MKYSISAQRKNGDGMCAGHNSAASALSGLDILKGEGAREIQVIDIRTGRLIDEAALRRADETDRHFARLRPANTAG